MGQELGVEIPEEVERKTLRTSYLFLKVFDKLLSILQSIIIDQGVGVKGVRVSSLELNEVLSGIVGEVSDTISKSMSLLSFQSPRASDPNRITSFKSNSLLSSERYTSSLDRHYLQSRYVKPHGFGIKRLLAEQTGKC